LNLENPGYILKMEAARSSEMPVIFYCSTWFHILEDSIFKSHKNTQHYNPKLKVIFIFFSVLKIIVTVGLHLREKQIACVLERGEYEDLRIERQKIMRPVA
jgi:hypothetical protein